MPVFLEAIETPNQDDHRDLTKVFNDAPQWLQSYNDVDQWLASIAASEELQLFAGRFNDRLITAAVVRKEEGKWHLEWLTVRTVTRDRCVGQRMVSEISRVAAENNCTLSAKPIDNAETLPSYLRALMGL
ncbi:acetyl-CoA sensor PanZ family protein [Sansalvadorimonas verongulae]|uniref:acetyl-CoA sensor PanZ family protein n=1 Tax=Sansalvadorimonas verongulae TaxID=2172824 RepID=UPI0012BC46A0|nr:acetyl-CoA sensor PanZ family protein [Sansalvadorimonas verongulae]MTI13213.1 GNAT family N-acetyltransferase [Sansalvadorimonas verongulae]